MFWKKLASRADETTTFELSFSGLKLAGQKKVSKTQGFSMFFFACQNSCHPLDPPTDPKIEKLKFS